jgi:Leucine-rich repeat (LRR) protein
MMHVPLPLRLLLMTSLVAAVGEDDEWKCPEFNEQPRISCSCDLPHTLRCSTDKSLLPTLTRRLSSTSSVSLLDCTVQNLTTLQSRFLEGVSLHGLVISSGELTYVSDRAFVGLKTPLQALGLPNNQLQTVPTVALSFLPGLDRLDLSHNKLIKLNSTSFRSLNNLTFLDLNENQISKISPASFSTLTSLEVLRLRNNRISLAVVSSLTHLNNLQELDLSTNALIGPLGPESLPSLQKLTTLQLANNQFSSVKRGALRGSYSLLTLSLNHNQIDVLEDHAFIEVPTLRQLDLANNRIVAVSGSSLAHLSQLTELDLAHNFLRALTADLIVPLASLRELRLDDNDISMVSSDALKENTLLQRLTLSDNPLNCDCTLIDFAIWFNNSSRLPMSDRSTAVCVTPPSLENGLLMEIPPKELRCGEEEDFGPAPPEGPFAAHVPVSGAQVMLRAFQYDGHSINLLWSVDSHAAPFTCDALFVYEELSAHEVLLTSTPLKCNSTQLADPTALTVRLPSGDMQPGRRYRYCVVLLEGGRYTDEVQLVLGCSEVIPLVITTQSVAQPPRTTSPTSIKSVHANITSSGTMTVSVQLWHQRKPGTTDQHCHVTVTVFMSGTLLAPYHLNCTQPWIAVPGLPQGPYHVCATLGNFPATEPRVQCVTVKSKSKFGGLNVTLTVCFVLLSSLLLLGLYIVTKKMMKKPKILSTHQCFLAPPEHDDQQHTRYVKLQATTKL